MIESFQSCFSQCDLKLNPMYSILVLRCQDLVVDLCYGYGLGT
jgi:hypothetical protein